MIGVNLCLHNCFVLKKSLESLDISEEICNFVRGVRIPMIHEI